MTTTPLTPKPRTSWLLIVSLALNLLVLGAAAGSFLAFHRGPPHLRDIAMGRIGPGDQGLRAFVKTLPRERRAEFRDLAEKIRTSMKPLRDGVRRARTEVSAALIAQPFSDASLEDAMNRLVAAENEVRRTAAAIMVSAVQRMTPAERERFNAWRKASERMMPPVPPEPTDADVPPLPASGRP